MRYDLTSYQPFRDWVTKFQSRTTAYAGFSLSHRPKISLFKDRQHSSENFYDRRNWTNLCKLASKLATTSQLIVISKTNNDILKKCISYGCSSNLHIFERSTLVNVTNPIFSRSNQVLQGNNIFHSQEMKSNNKPMGIHKHGQDEKNLLPQTL